MELMSGLAKDGRTRPPAPERAPLETYRFFLP